MNSILVPGTRVRLRMDLHILHSDRVPAGVTGIVAAATPERLAVRLDEHRPGLDAWGNEIRLYPGDAPGHDLEALAWLLFELRAPA